MLYVFVSQPSGYSVLKQLNVMVIVKTTPLASYAVLSTVVLVVFHAALFMVFDRGMGVVSLRSWKHPGYWLRIDGVLMGKVCVYIELHW